MLRSSTTSANPPLLPLQAAAAGAARPYEPPAEPPASVS